MPTAVSNIEDTEHHDLKSCPGGFVVLRRMTFGQIVQRRSLSKMHIMAQTSKKSSIAGEMAMASREITVFEFQNCIVEHNLEDIDGRLLQLGGTDFDKLDPRIGQEIEAFISTMNNFDEETEGN